MTMKCTEREMLRDIQEGFKLIADAVGKEKEKALAEVRDRHPEAWTALRYLLDPMLTYGIGDKSLERDLPETPTPNYYLELGLYGMLESLNLMNGVPDKVIRRVQNYIAEYAEYADLIRGIVTKSIKLGVTGKTANKVERGYISSFEVMLANKYFEHQDFVEGKEFTITEKLDGVRCACMVAYGSVKMFSRQGQLITGLVDIENQLRSLWEKLRIDFMLDGELLLSDRTGIPSKEQYKRTMKIVRSDGQKHGIAYNVFDIMTYSAFTEQTCLEKYSVRRQNLTALVQGKYSLIHVVPVLYSGNDTSMIAKCLEEQRRLEHEGVMININDAPYQFKRTNELLKVKLMQDCDLKVIGIEEGSGKFKGMTGALVVDYKGNPLGVGSGMSDDFRRYAWEHREEIIGRVIKVQYFEESQDADGVLSLRFPVFLELREDGKEVSYE